jgi:enoyl-CoA hydratase/carnithine racemase
MAAGLARPAEQLRLCYRWYHLLNLAGAMDLSDVLGANGPLADPASARHRGLVREVFLDNAEALDANLAALAGAAPPDALAAETAALRGQIGRLAEFLATARDPGAPVIHGEGARGWRDRSRLVARLLAISDELGSTAG